MHEAKKLAKEHWDWLGKLIGEIYVEAMIHGFKHGLEFAQANFQSGPKIRNKPYGPPRPRPQCKPRPTFESKNNST
jgi:hypothetical protein